MHTIRLGAAWRSAGERASRRFHRPTGLAPGDEVWLAWDGAAAAATLNGQPIAPTGRSEVLRLLGPSNELVLHEASSALLESVRLEIVPAG